MENDADDEGAGRAARLLAILLLVATALAPQVGQAQDQAVRWSRDASVVSTADHEAFDSLKQRFRSPEEVTEACLGCHTRAADQIHATLHWTWSLEVPTIDRPVGKRNLVNSFFTAITSNLEDCTGCHIGNGWTTPDFDFSAKASVDCLVCHDTTGQYAFEKFHANDADCQVCHDDRPRFDRAKMRQRPTLDQMAQAVGPTSRATCGLCHFDADGGDGVKHGDLNSGLLAPTKALDVHMDQDGLNFSCSTCHATRTHDVTGSRYLVRAVDRAGIDVPGRTDFSRASCESCHGLTPHPAEDHPKLNDHTDRVACVTCHVPSVARGDHPTVVDWDWSTAGKLDDRGQPFVEKEGEQTVYSSLKGSWTWASDLQPTYRWFDGTTLFSTVGDPVDGEVVEINRVQGSADDPDARIWPFKVVNSRIPYDQGAGVLAVAHLSERDDDGYWRDFDWAASLDAGMTAAGLQFSGEPGFIAARYLSPVVHMVAPKEDAVGCDECHTRAQSRMAGITGIYMPGRDNFGWLTLLGWTVAGLTLLASLGHLALRLFGNARRRH